MQLVSKQNMVVFGFNYLSHKKAERVDLLQDLKLSEGKTTDMFGNQIKILTKRGNHYMSPIKPERPLKSTRFRANVYINGRKVSYKDTENHINNNGGYFHSYFNDSKKNVNNSVVDANLYDESLINSEIDYLKREELKAYCLQKVMNFLYQIFLNTLTINIFLFM